MGSTPTPGTMMRRLISKLVHRFVRYAPLIHIEISKSSLLHNLHTYQTSYPHLKIAPVLKSNAYGHGLSTVASVLDTEDIAFFMVDSWYEAKELRRNGIRSRIVVMGYVRPEDIVHSKLRDVDFAIVDIEQLRSVTRLAASPLRIHLKLDVGMHRQGIMPDALQEAIALCTQNAHLGVVGVCSHVGDADNTDDTLTRAQVEVWKNAIAPLLVAFPSIEYRHLAATKGIRFAKEAGTNVARVGIGLYGIDTSPHNTLPLRPVLSMYSLISSLRTIPAGSTVGYNATYTAQNERRLAVIPTGYFEGVDRRLSNKGTMLVHGEPCSIVGRVSMNMTTIDVTDVIKVQVGDEVCVISSNPKDPNSIASMAKGADTTPYVLFAHIPQHLRRNVGK